jgi:hypothetical protein
MRGVEPGDSSWQRCWPHWPNADSGPRRDAHALDELRQHWPCRLADGDDIDGRGTRQRIVDRCVAKRGPNEHRRISRTHGCEQDVL